MYNPLLRYTPFEGRIIKGTLDGNILICDASDVPEFKPGANGKVKLNIFGARFYMTEAEANHDETWRAPHIAASSLDGYYVSTIELEGRWAGGPFETMIFSKSDETNIASYDVGEPYRNETFDAAIAQHYKIVEGIKAALKSRTAI